MLNVFLHLLKSNGVSIKIISWVCANINQQQTVFLLTKSNKDKLNTVTNVLLLVISVNAFIGK